MILATKMRSLFIILLPSILSACGGSSDGQPNVTVSFFDAPNRASLVSSYPNLTHFIERSGLGAQVMINWSKF